MNKIYGVVAIAALMLAGPVFAQVVKVDAGLDEYKAVGGVSGTVNSVGSDTLNNLMTLWAEGFKAMYPNVKIGIEGKGSTTAPPALIEGTSQFGPMSREMKPTEVDAFEKKYGYKPTQIKVAIDALAVYVNKDNPINGMTLQQVDGIFSSTRKRGGKEIKTWGQLGLTGDWANKPVSLYGRNSASGTYGFFKEHVMQNGDYKATVKEQPGSSAVVQGVTSDLGGIGYSGIGYKTSGVNALPLGAAAGQLFEPSYDNALGGKYPIARFLYIYVNKAPGQPLGTLEQEFLRYVLSRQGQEIVVKDGYFPLPLNIAQENLGKISK
jgi:phosphate transport system substrate-binding protein